MMTTVAVLIIVLGVMVSLARHVRERAAVALTKDLLRRLDQVMAEYAGRHGGQLPVVGPFPPAPPGAATSPARRPGDTTTAVAAGGPDLGPKPDRAALGNAARANNYQWVAALKADGVLTGGALSTMPASVYDGIQLRDAWGSPIVFMPTKHPWVGTAPRTRSAFFFYAGPDRQYLTQDDNLYSYEDPALR